ncbi:MAG: hypothetical protein AB7T31_00010 [Gemmatimonadales bacterium]
MSPRKHILRELASRSEAGATHAYVRPSEIPGYTGAPERYQAAVNELLRERLVEGRSDADGRLSLSLNAHRLDDVRKALRPAWARPSVWIAAAVVAALLAAWGAGLKV